jgi:putative chitinase
VTPDQLRELLPFARQRAEYFAGPLELTCKEFEINTRAREAAFLAQIAQESGELRYTRELASGAAYEGRADLGNTQPGDGVRYKGRGLIQVTGRANYAECGKALALDLINCPELLEVLPAAARSAGWFWKSRGLNELADVDDFDRITRRINGGLTHIDERRVYWRRAKRILGIDP